MPRSRATVERLCLYCNDMYKARVERVKKGLGKFCSSACSLKYRHTSGLNKGEHNPNWKGGVSKDNMRYKNRFKAKSPEKVSAHTILHTAVRYGKIFKPTTCQFCNKTGKIEGHHEDYSKPIEVIWLCRACHIKADKALRERSSIAG